jgi:hypothetical protein
MVLTAHYDTSYRKHPDRMPFPPSAVMLLFVAAFDATRVAAAVARRLD